MKRMLLYRISFIRKGLVWHKTEENKEGAGLHLGGI